MSHSTSPPALRKRGVVSTKTRERKDEGRTHRRQGKPILDTSEDGPRDDDCFEFSLIPRWNCGFGAISATAVICGRPVCCVSLEEDFVPSLVDLARELVEALLRPPASSTDQGFDAVCSMLWGFCYFWMALRVKGLMDQREREREKRERSYPFAADVVALVVHVDEHDVHEEARCGEAACVCSCDGLREPVLLALAQGRGVGDLVQWHGGGD